MPPTATTTTSSRQPFGEQGNNSMLQIQQQQQRQQQQEEDLRRRSKSSGRSMRLINTNSHHNHNNGSPEQQQQQQQLLRSLQQAMHDRRSQSRPHTIRSETYERERPRPLSTGRALLQQDYHHANTEDTDDPASVTRAILDLRDKREQAHRHRESFKQQQQQQHHHHHQRQESSVTPTSPTAQGGSGNARLKHAEDKISNLMQELEELKFFHEIEITAPSPTTSLQSPTSIAMTQARTMQPQQPSQSRRAAAPTTLRAVPPPPPPPPPPAARIASKSTSAAAAAPQQQQQQPPSPRRSILESRPKLSPRRIAALDRTSLELETQELQRRVDILQQEHLSLTATMEMCEQQLAGREHDAQRIHLLEDALADVRNELSRQLQEVHHGKAQLSDQYEAKLDQLRNQCAQSKQDAEDGAYHLATLKKDMAVLEECYHAKEEQAKQKYNQQVRMAEEKEGILELQLAETTMQLDTFKETMEDQARFIAKIESEVLETTERLERELKDQQERYNQNLRGLEDQLTGSRLLAERLEVDHGAQQALVETKNEEIKTLQDTNDVQSKQLSAMELQMATMKAQYETDMDALKKTYEDLQREHLDGVVQSNFEATKEMEGRMNDLQRQLTLANDRHESEMQAKELDVSRRVQEQLELASQAVLAEHQVQIAKLKDEFVALTQQYDVSQEELLRVQVLAESKDRDVAREWERKDAMRQSELERMNDKLDKAMRDLSERDAKLQLLASRLADAEESKKASLLELEAQHEEEVKVREELLSNQRKVWKASEAKLRTELARKESELLEMHESKDDHAVMLKHEVEQLRKQLDEKEKSREDMDQHFNAKIALLQASVEKTQQDLVSEQSRHEALESELRVEMAKLEGKLSATESTLKEKRRLIEDLEQKLTHADDEVSTVGSKLHAELFALRRDLDASRELLLKEQSLAEQKEQKIAELMQEQQADKVRLQQLLESEEKMAVLQNAVDEAHREKSVHMDELNKLQEEQEIAADRLEQTKKKLAIEKEQVSMELIRKQKEIETTIEQFTSTVVDLEMKLEQKDEEMVALKEEISDLKQCVRDASEASVARSMDSKGLQNKVSELETLVANYKEESAKLELEKRQKIIELESKLEGSKKVHEEMARQMEDVVSERAEAFEALEQVINEVHIREDELDSLSTVLEKRDNELENAKIIATKALAQAQEIKAKYLEKGFRESDRHVELQIQIDELSASLDFLNEKNDKLRSKVVQLETELREKNMECIRLKDALRDAAGPQEKAPVISDFSALVDEHGFLPLDLSDTNSPILKAGKMDEFMLMESGFSMVHSDESSQSSSTFMMDESMSTNTANLGGATHWLEDFHNNNNNNNTGSVCESGDGVRSEPGAHGIPRRSMERDSLRKYVRRRYLKQQGKQSANSENRSAF